MLSWGTVLPLSPILVRVLINRVGVIVNVTLWDLILAYAVYIITDDQDIKLGSLDVQP